MFYLYGICYKFNLNTSALIKFVMMFWTWECCKILLSWVTGFLDDYTHLTYCPSLLPPQILHYYMKLCFYLLLSIFIFLLPFSLSILWLWIVISRALVGKNCLSHENCVFTGKKSLITIKKLNYYCDWYITLTYAILYSHAN